MWKLELSQILDFWRLLLPHVTLLLHYFVFYEEMAQLKVFTKRKIVETNKILPHKFDFPLYKYRSNVFRQTH